jgi:hypothetical protein
MTTCRLCGLGEEAERNRGVSQKYGRRHYPHSRCGLEKCGAAFFERLPLWRLQNFPARLAHEAGLLEALEAAVAARRMPAEGKGGGHDG